MLDSAILNDRRFQDALARAWADLARDVASIVDDLDPAEEIDFGVSPSGAAVAWLRGSGWSYLDGRLVEVSASRVRVFDLATREVVEETPIVRPGLQ